MVNYGRSGLDGWYGCLRFCFGLVYVSFVEISEMWAVGIEGHLSDLRKSVQSVPSACNPILAKPKKKFRIAGALGPLKNKILLISPPNPNQAKSMLYDKIYFFTGQAKPAR